jgi:putative NADH-flavin reductase
MRVVLYGATGKVGSVILKELIDRGHSVAAVARTPEKVKKLKNVTVVQGDLSDPATIAGIIKRADALFRPMGRRPTKQLRSSPLWTASFEASRKLVDLASS